MRTYTTPKMTSEQFAPNEYISACWQVACKVGDGDYGRYGYRDKWRQWKGVAPFGSNCNDHTGSCSKAENNVFTVDDNGNVTFDFENSSDQGTLYGGYTSYIDNNHNYTIDSGDTIFWYTLSSDSNRRWNHYGTVQSSTNRS